MARYAFDTVANVINDAAVELGLYSSDIEDPFASTDPSVLLLIRLLKGLGQDLARDHQWSQLQKQATLNTSNGTADYDMPVDLLRPIDQTEWNRTQQMPLGGPASPQEWQLLKAVSAAGVVYKIFRISGDQIHIVPTPTGVETLAYEYISSYWVSRSAEPNGPDQDEPLAAEDELWFDRRLLVTGLKLRFREAKGFDTTTEQRAFDLALSRAKGGDGAAPVLSLNGNAGFPLLGMRNVPQTGFGS